MSYTPKFQWEVAVARIGQFASEMRLSTGGQSIGGSNVFRYLQFCQLTIDEYIFIGPLYEILWL